MTHPGVMGGRCGATGGDTGWGCPKALSLAKERPCFRLGWPASWPASAGWGVREVMSIRLDCQQSAGLHRRTRGLVSCCRQGHACWMTGAAGRVRAHPLPAPGACDCLQRPKGAARCGKDAGRRRADQSHGGCFGAGNRRVRLLFLPVRFQGVGSGYGERAVDVFAQHVLRAPAHLEQDPTSGCALGSLLRHIRSTRSRHAARNSACGVFQRLP